MKSRDSLLLAIVVSACVSSDFTCLSNVSVSTLIDQLCSEMSGMPGCSLREACESNTGYCDESVIYALICQEMPGMTACSTYQSECSSAPTCDLLPSSKTTTEQIFSICSEMNMNGCEKCNISANSVYSECDLIGTYSNLCKSMPGMQQCSTFNAICANDETLPWCPNSSSAMLDAPTMKMYFHTGFADYILFEQFVPRTPLQYFLAVFGCFIAAAMYEGLQVYKVFLELKWAKEIRNSVADITFDEKQSYDFMWNHIAGFGDGKNGVSIALKRGFLHLLSTTIGYSLMLVAMTFNIGIFISVVTGFGLGSVLFSPLIQKFRASLMLQSSLGDSCHR